MNRMNVICNLLVIVPPVTLYGPVPEGEVVIGVNLIFVPFHSLLVKYAKFDKSILGHTEYTNTHFHYSSQKGFKVNK